jgi:hypothetical protein
MPPGRNRAAAGSIRMMNLRGGLKTFVRWAQARQRSAMRAQRMNSKEIFHALAKERGDLNHLFAKICKDGVVAVSGYWSPDRCVQARAEIDRLISDFPMAVQNHSGGADKRMFGVESASALLALFHADPFLRKFGEMMCGLDLYNFATLGARIVATPENRGSGDGWHRDAHGFQFKSILYLSDTLPENGPFEYLAGSHKDWRAGMDTALGDLPDYPNTRFTNEQIDALSPRIGGRRTSFPAEAGTLLLVNTSGIHRGQPLASGLRYAITNYFYHRCDIDEARLAQFSPMIPGTAERVRRDLLEAGM